MRKRVPEGPRRARLLVLVDESNVGTPAAARHSPTSSSKTAATRASARREPAVERPDPHSGLRRDPLQRRGRAVLGERAAAQFAVAPRVAAESLLLLHAGQASRKRSLPPFT